MLPLQASDLQAGFRRLLGTVGQQTLSIEEVLAGVVKLGDATQPPYRVFARSFYSAVQQDGGAPRNAVLCSLPLADADGCALVMGAEIHITEAAGAAGGLLALATSPLAPSGAFTLSQLTEPVAQDAAGMITTRPAVTGDGLWSNAGSRNLRLQSYAGAAAAGTGALWLLDPPVMLVPPPALPKIGFNNAVTSLVAWALGLDGAGNAIGIEAAFWGVYLPVLPAR